VSTYPEIFKGTCAGAVGIWTVYQLCTCKYHRQTHAFYRRHNSKLDVNSSTLACNEHVSCIHNSKSSLARHKPHVISATVYSITVQML